MEFTNDTNIQSDSDFEIKLLKGKFNWGAFGFTWIWGLGNGSFHNTWYILLVWPLIIVCLLMFKEIGNIIGLLVLHLPLSIYFGLNGNKWAFDNRAWWSVEDCDETQKRWAIAFAIFGSLQAIAFMFRLMLSIMSKSVGQM